LDLGKVPLFSLVAQRMSWLSERHRVLAENVANADTPGYRAQDLAPMAFKEGGHGGAPSAGLTQTHAQHFRGSSQAADGRLTSAGNRKLLSGNTVSMNDEMMKISDTANDFSLVTNLYRRQIGMLRSVLSRGN
jgi:flagellar basal-body rod protein FlgB